MDTHDPKAQSTVLGPGLVDLLEGQLSFQCSQKQELSSQVRYLCQLGNGVDPAEVQRSQITDIAVILGSHFGTCVPERLVFLVEEVEAEPWLCCAKSLTDVLEEDRICIVAAPETILVDQPLGLVVDRDVRHVERSREVEVLLLDVPVSKTRGPYGHVVPVLRVKELPDVWVSLVQRGVDGRSTRTTLHDTTTDLIGHLHLGDRSRGMTTRPGDQSAFFTVDRVVVANTATSHQSVLDLPR